MTSDELRSLIQERGFTYESLGLEIGISKQAVNEIVQGRSRGATGRYAVAKALGREVGDLWPDDRPGAVSPAA